MQLAAIKGHACFIVIFYLNVSSSVEETGNEYHGREDGRESIFQFEIFLTVSIESPHESG